MTLHDILNAKAPFERLYRQTLPAQSAFAVRKIARSMEEHIRDYAETRDKWAADNAVDLQHMSEQQARELQEMLEAEIDISWRPIDNLGNAELSAADIDRLVQAEICRGDD